MDWLLDLSHFGTDSRTKLSLRCSYIFFAQCPRPIIYLILAVSADFSISTHCQLSNLLPNLAFAQLPSQISPSFSASTVQVHPSASPPPIFPVPRLTSPSTYLLTSLALLDWLAVLFPPRFYQYFYNLHVHFKQSNKTGNLLSNIILH